MRTPLILRPRRTPESCQRSPVRLDGCVRGTPLLAAVLMIGAVLAVTVSDRAPGPGRAAGLFQPASALAVGPVRSANRTWRPHVRKARRYAAHRAGAIAFGVRTPRHLYGVGLRRQVSSASVVKAMLMVAYLNSRAVRGRRLRDFDRSLLVPMVTRSDNDAASTVRDIVGNDALERLAGRVGMRDFATEPSWGNSQVTVADQTKLFLRIERFVVRRHRDSAMRLLCSIVPYQRWGIAAAVPPGWALYFKGGWVQGTQNQVGLLRRGRRRLAIAVFVTGPRDYGDGRETERGVARRLLRGVDEDTVPR